MKLNLENWLVRNYLAGRLPLSDGLLDVVLSIGTDLYYRFGPRLDSVPDQWGGDVGAIIPAGERLMELHYDQPAVLFENFLGETMKYSVGLWDTGADSLDHAQRAMMDDVCRKMDLQDGHSILDIGCGFGSFGRYVLDRYPHVQFVGLTMSQTQADYIRERQQTPGHPFNSPRFQLVQADFNHVEFPRTFDRIISIGVFEHVSNLRKACDTISQWLKADGACFLHFITYKKIIHRFANVDMQDTFIAKYLYPETRFWHEGELYKRQHLLRIQQQWHLSGVNYAKTLAAWRTQFRRREEVMRTAAGLDDLGIRIWILYFSFTRALFAASRGRQVGNSQYLLRHAMEPARE
jgi:cyclopropane-fatty-acyl-phospholipid synthase